MMLKQQRSNPANAGWTLIELVFAMALAAVLASLSYPSLRSIIHRIHRSEALTTLAQVQLLQQRYRSNHSGFATLGELGVAATSAGGRYRLTERVPGVSGFAVMAVAEGAQAADLRCSHLLLEAIGADTRWASGPDTGFANDETDNRRCWGQ